MYEQVSKHADICEKPQWEAVRPLPPPAPTLNFMACLLKVNDSMGELPITLVCHLPVNSFDLRRAESVWTSPIVFRRYLKNGGDERRRLQHTCSYIFSAHVKNSNPGPSRSGH